MPVLAKAVNDPDANRRLMATKALGELGSKAGTAIPLLKSLVQSRDEEVKSAAADALRRIESEEDARQAH